MNHDYEHTEFSKALLAGVFGGISATVLSLAFNFIFRGTMAFNLSEIINVSTIIFALLLVVTIAGLIFYVFHHYLKNGSLIFQAVAVVLTLLLLLGTTYIQRSPNPVLTVEFRELLEGIIVITALCVVFIIPFLFKHDYV